MEYVLEYGVDALLIILVIITVADSARRGFLRCVLSLVCVAVALFAAFRFSQPAAEWSYDNLLSEPIESKVSQALTEGFDSESAAQTVIQTIDMIPEVLTSQLSDFGVDIDSLSDQIASLKLSPDDTAQKISVEIIRPGALVLLKLICYILIFIAVRFILGLFIGLIDKLPSPAILQSANKWLGAGLGAVKGVILAFVLCLLLNALSGLFDSSGQIGIALENSRICQAVSNLGAPDLSSIDFDFEKDI